MGLYRLIFKAHRQSERLYELTGTKAAVFFTKAALDNTGWVIIGVEKVK